MTEAEDRSYRESLSDIKKTVSKVGLQHNLFLILNNLQMTFEKLVCGSYVADCERDRALQDVRSLRENGLL